MFSSPAARGLTGSLRVGFTELGVYYTSPQPSHLQFSGTMHSSSTFEWHVGERILQRKTIPLLMGILNVTPDSFSDGGQFDSTSKAIEQALKLINDGADIVDVGGESTRPGAAPVSLQEELDRTIPVIARLSQQTDVPISIDTTKAEVARQAMAAGASIVNDISGLSFDPEMISVCAKSQAAVCVMHIKGTPQSMQQAPVYDDVVDEVAQFLLSQCDACVAGGIPMQRICIDPGIGFGKTAAHNLELMHATEALANKLKRPILVGHSRKSFLSKLLGRSIEERNYGTIGVSIALAENGADLLRIHDVAACRDALIAWHAVKHQT